MRTLFLIFLMMSLSVFAATYDTLEVVKYKDKDGNVERIRVKVRVTVGTEQEETVGYIPVGDVAAANADVKKIEDFAATLAAQVEKRLDKKIQDNKEQKVDPTTVVISPAKVASEKAKL